MNLRFHWMLPKAGELALETAEAAACHRINSTNPDSPARLPDIAGWTRFALAAEDCGIDSLLISFGYYEPDPLPIACALGTATDRIAFIAAYRTGLLQPATLVQQINTLSSIIDGRISLNIVAGSSQREQHGYGDFLNHDDRYARADEFLDVCHAFWNREAEQEVNFEGTHYCVTGGRLHTPFVSRRRRPPVA